MDIKNINYESFDNWGKRLDRWKTKSLFGKQRVYSRKSIKKKNFPKINWASNSKIRKSLQEHRCVINCSGFDVHQSKDEKKTNLINAEYPKRLFKAANKNNVKLFIFLSTYHVYDLN